jgi:hypothetical protein
MSAKRLLSTRSRRLSSYPPHLSEHLLWMAPALQEKFDVLALVGSSLLFGLLMQSTLDCWP